MEKQSGKAFTPRFQYIVSILSILMAAAAGYAIQHLVGYKAVALILLVVVSLLAMLFDIWPVLIAAILSALILNFFFIPPLFTFHIRVTEDVLLFTMYFLVAMVNAILTHKIRMQARNIQDKEEKEKVIQLYHTLFNSLSHELKTPIATIIGAADTLTEGDNTLTPEVKTALLTEIAKAGQRLNRQVENLLHMSRLDSGMLLVRKDWTDMHELVHKAIRRLDAADQHRIRYNHPANLPLFKMDAGLMEQVIYNLIHNGTQYTAGDSPIELSITQSADQCIITVSDHGPGIPPEEMKTIFEPFYRVPGTQAGGTGIGLSIVKGFVVAHGGTVEVEPNPGGGARFVVTLPSETSYLNYIRNE